MARAIKKKAVPFCSFLANSQVSLSGFTLFHNKPWEHYKSFAINMSAQKIAIVSVFDKTGLLDLAKGLVQQNVRILASGGTSRMIRESGFPVE